MTHDHAASGEAGLRAELECQRQLQDERWGGWKALDAATRRAVDMRLEAIERLHASVTQSLERRLDELAKAQTALADKSGDYLLTSVHAKDMERLYNERQQQNAIAAQARLQAEQSAVSNRRTLLATLVAASVSILSVGVTILLHFLDNLRQH